MPGFTLSVFCLMITTLPPFFLLSSTSWLRYYHFGNVPFYRRYLFRARWLGLSLVLGFIEPFVATAGVVAEFPRPSMLGVQAVVRFLRVFLRGA